MSGDSSFSFAISTEHLTRPATLLVQKISDAIGVLYQPTHVRRMAQAAADAQLIAARGEIALTDLNRRAIARLIQEESQNQANIESITAAAFPLLDENSSADQLDNDWIRIVFDKARLVNNSEMQQLWAKVLARQVNVPNALSIHAINALSSMDRLDAQMFARACQVVAKIEGQPALIVMETSSFRIDGGSKFAELRRLEELGLVRIETAPSFEIADVSDPFDIAYGELRGTLKFTQEGRNVMTGYADFTSIGWQLFHALPTRPLPGMWAYLREHWSNQSHLEIVSWDSP